MFNYKKIKELREERGVTKQDIINALWDDCGFRISRQSWDMWESGRVKIKVEHLCHIAKLFEVPMEVFFKEKE